MMMIAATTTDENKNDKIDVNVALNNISVSGVNVAKHPAPPSDTSSRSFMKPLDISLK